jgi:hypothetical protein
VSVSLAQAEVSSLLEMLAGITVPRDPRDPRGVRHPLVAVLEVAVVALAGLPTSGSWSRSRWKALNARPNSEYSAF